MPDHDDELPSIEDADLKAVTGGAGMDMSSMLPMILMMKNRGGGQSAPQVAAAPAAPPQPKLFVDGVEEPLSGSNGSYTADA